MKFIKVEELKVRKFYSLIKDVGEDNQYILDEIEQMAIDEISSYLSARYDTDYLFSRKDNARSALLKRLTIDFMLCYLWERTNSNEMPTSLSDRCDKNTEWLTNAANGKFSPNFPTRDPELERTSLFQGGSETIFNDVNHLD